MPERFGGCRIAMIGLYFLLSLGVLALVILQLIRMGRDPLSTAFIMWTFFIFFASDVAAVRGLPTAATLSAFVAGALAALSLAAVVVPWQRASGWSWLLSGLVYALEAFAMSSTGLVLGVLTVLVTGPVTPQAASSQEVAVALQFAPFLVACSVVLTLVFPVLEWLYCCPLFLDIEALPSGHYVLRWEARRYSPAPQGWQIQRRDAGGWRTVAGPSVTSPWTDSHAPAIDEVRYRIFAVMSPRARSCPSYRTAVPLVTLPPSS